MKSMEHKNEDIICFSHLRWNFVYQRPQHLMTRFAKHHRVFYFEEPVISDHEHYTIEPVDANVFVVVPHITEGSAKQKTAAQQRILDNLLDDIHIKTTWLWYYTPMALSFSMHLKSAMIIYDCMDELSAFKFAPSELQRLEKALMLKADVVFTGGYHLYEAKRKLLKNNIYAFPSSIDKNHFGKARTIKTETADQQNIPRPRIGYSGVIDERINIELITALANQRPDWNFVFVGPVVKIDPETLPNTSNIFYLGMKSYEDLPAYLAGWDVAWLPFAINKSTEFISPTKTPEYLAAGKPVVSSPITDVVKMYGFRYVRIAHTPVEFMYAIEAELNNTQHIDKLKQIDLMLSDSSWDVTWNKMYAIITDSYLQKSAEKISVLMKGDELNV